MGPDGVEALEFLKRKLVVFPRVEFMSLDFLCVLFARSGYLFAVIKVRELPGEVRGLVE